MSLFRQLWLSIITLTVFVFLGSFLVSVLSARNYLEEQLLIKNGDNAAALALSLSQLPEKDPVTVALMVSAPVRYRPLSGDTPGRSEQAGHCRTARCDPGERRA